MNEELSIGHIKIVNQYGTVIVYQENTVSPDNVITSQEVLVSLTFSDNAHIYYENIIIGKIYRRIFNKTNGYMTLYFELNDTKEANFVYDNQEHIEVVPVIETKKVMCPVCQSVYNIGETPCSCIYLSPFVIPQNINVISLHFYDFLCNNIIDVYDNRYILRTMFGGSMSNIILTEPI